MNSSPKLIVERDTRYTERQEQRPTDEPLMEFHRLFSHFETLYIERMLIEKAI
jgi:hypothetical protein